MDEVIDDTPTFTLSEDDLDLFEERPDDKRAETFFELDDLPPVPHREPIFAPHVASPVEEKPVVRKVNPYEIPAGHVDLSDSERTASVFDGFDLDDPESLVGRTVKGRYKVIEYLSGDETGLSYLADDRIVGERKVIVRILLESESDPMLSSILAEERVSFSHFSHPNIARLIDSGAFTNGTEFLISEFTDALSVRDVMSIHGKFPPPRAARVIKQASYALSEAHQEGIIHRDIRPENLILSAIDAENELQIVNFGASSGEPNDLNAPYKAPEVLDGRTSTVASDIYSLAVVAYEILTGKLPFTGTTAKEYIRAQHRGLAASVDSSLTPAVADVFDKALSFKPAGRYARARDFGDAFAAAISDAAVSIPTPTPTPTRTLTPTPTPTRPIPTSKDFAVDLPLRETSDPPPIRKIEVIKPIDTRPTSGSNEPAWKNRSPERPQEETSRAKLIGLVAILALLAILAFGWYYIVYHPPSDPGVQAGVNTTNENENTTPTISSDAEMPPQPRKIMQPPNSEYYANSKQNLKGDLLRNFVGFSLYYPKEWKINGPQEGTSPTARGKFLDISRLTADGKPKEQMLISYYPSKGTFNADADKFAQLVKESNETLKKILPGYQMISEGEIKVNGDWRAYEVRFQGEGTAENGDKLTVWGRRLFIPASRPGVRSGFEITMIATSLADEVRSVDDVGVHGELAPILYSFEPSQNF